MHFLCLQKSECDGEHYFCKVYSIKTNIRETLWIIPHKDYTFVFGTDSVEAMSPYRRCNE